MPDDMKRKMAELAALEERMRQLKAELSGDKFAGLPVTHPKGGYPQPQRIPADKLDVYARAEQRLGKPEAQITDREWDMLEREEIESRRPMVKAGPSSKYPGAMRPGSVPYVPDEPTPRMSAQAYEAPMDDRAYWDMLNERDAKEARELEALQAKWKANNWGNTAK